jgi:hypothetical protein
MKVYWVLLTCITACGVNVVVPPGKACDELHACASGTQCVKGRCGVEAAEGDGGFSTSQQPSDAGDSGAVTGDAGSVVLDGGIDGPDANFPDAGLLNEFDAGANQAGLGTPCTDDNRCGSKICSQGVCCDARCEGACQTQNMGRCQLRTQATPAVPACGGFLLCDGQQATCPTSCNAATCVTGTRCSTRGCVQKMGSLVTDFSNGWSPQFSSYTYGQAGTANSVTGQIHLTNANSESGVGIQTTDLYDLENSSVTIELVSSGPLSSSRESSLTLQATDTTDAFLAIIQGGDKVRAKYHINGSPDYPVLGEATVSSSNALKFRIRSNQSMLTFELFSNGAWRQLSVGSNPLGTPLLNMRIQMLALCYATSGCVSGTSIFDNLNTP